VSCPSGRPCVPAHSSAWTLFALDNADRLQRHDGQEWDFLFDVEVEDQIKLKMPMNRGEDPYTVADRFMLQNGLPMTYRERIVDFVLQNVGASGRLCAFLLIFLLRNFCYSCARCMLAMCMRGPRMIPPFAHSTVWTQSCFPAVIQNLLLVQWHCPPAIPIP
jgi:hypothetical protein